MLMWFCLIKYVLLKFIIGWFACLKLLSCWIVICCLILFLGYFEASNGYFWHKWPCLTHARILHLRYVFPKSYYVPQTKILRKIFMLEKLEYKLTTLGPMNILVLPSRLFIYAKRSFSSSCNIFFQMIPQF